VALERSSGTYGGRMTSWWPSGMPSKSESCQNDWGEIGLRTEYKSQPEWHEIKSGKGGGPCVLIPSLRIQKSKKLLWKRPSRV
jgi:hypothetical protein